MLELRKATESDYEILCGLSVTESQAEFVLPVSDTWTEKKAEEDFYVICLKETDAEELVIGFFLIDRSFANHQTFRTYGDLGLRSFFIDKAHQGKGYGKEACLQLGPFVKDNYPQSEKLVLTVNVRNPKARALYLACDFVDTQQLYLGGPVGPQHILSLSVK